MGGFEPFWNATFDRLNAYLHDGFTITTHAMDVRPERLVFLHGSVENDPEAFDASVTFTDQGGKTLVTMRSVFRTKAQYDQVVGFGAVELGLQTLRRCAEYLEAPRPATAPAGRARAG